MSGSGTLLSISWERHIPIMTSVGRRRKGKRLGGAEEGSSEDPSKGRERKEGRQQIKEAKAKTWSLFREQQNQEGRRFWWENWR